MPTISGVADPMPSTSSIADISPSTSTVADSLPSASHARDCSFSRVQVGSKKVSRKELIKKLSPIPQLKSIKIRKTKAQQSMTMHSSPMKSVLELKAQKKANKKDQRTSWQLQKLKELRLILNQKMKIAYALFA